MSSGDRAMGPVGYSSSRPPGNSDDDDDDDADDEDFFWALAATAGKNLARSFSRERVLAWNKGPDCVYPADVQDVASGQRGVTLCGCGGGTTGEG